MIIIFKFFVTFFFISLSFLIYKNLKGYKFNFFIFLILLCLIFLLKYIRYFLDNLFKNKSTFFILIIFSLSMIILLYIMQLTNHFLRKNHNKIKEPFMIYIKNIISFLKKEGIIILITLYQLLLIWEIVKFPIIT